MCTYLRLQLMFSAGRNYFESTTGERKASKFTTALTVKDEIFNEIPEENRNKETFTKAIGNIGLAIFCHVICIAGLFLRTNTRLQGHTEFIYAALKRMREFGVHKDLEVYKRLLEVFPKGKMIPKNFFQVRLARVEGMHYPKQQQCCIDVLDEIEWNRVFPDKELYMIVKNAFGEWTHAMRKMKRMMYWMPKLKNADPYPMPRPLPRSEVELAKAAMSRVCRDPSNITNLFYTEAISEEVEKTWIVSGQSPIQQELLEKHSLEDALFVDGPYRVWLMDRSLFYFTLVSDRNALKRFDDFQPENSLTGQEWANWKTKYNSEFSDYQQALSLIPTIHEQPDGTIMATAITGNSSKDSLVCWIKFLEEYNCNLARIPVVFRLRHATSDVMSKDESATTLKEI
ncbi:ECIST Cterm and ECSIT domain containing protein [Trichuris trichiura]|uniref:Evolutionarily conserved signaling intermediate in Toll pathway, mitochondrial n=1 Tax=Trichuris trichiura TaxID=36087 RepID=A0A077ZCQ6_TRITR|nr:ECIST Cterm and ECSIT domain containing protein [Trichuris trichiura]